MNKNDKNGNQKNRIKIIISPAKKMKETDVLPPESTPVFLSRTEHLLSYMKKMSLPQLQAVWKCNDKARAGEFRADRRHGSAGSGWSPAILTYEGIQYKYMAPAVFDEEAYAYLQEHLYILSGFYGAVKPFDGVTPYRLEMQARFGRPELDSLYDYWGESIADEVLRDCGPSY